MLHVPADEPPQDVAFGSQLLHTVFPAAALKKSVIHATHTKSAVPASTAPYPLLHVPMEAPPHPVVEPTAVVVSQSAHKVLPLDVLNFPRAHATHVAPSPAYPAAQILQALAPTPDVV